MNAARRSRPAIWAEGQPRKAGTLIAFLGLSGGLALLAGAFVIRASAPGRVTLLLAGVALVEIAGFVGLARRIDLRVVGLTTPASRPAYAVALSLAAAYIGFTIVGNSGVRVHLFAGGWLKLLAVFTAVVAGSFEETIFRGMLMTRLERRGRGAAVQIAVSGAAFGAAHFYAFAGIGPAIAAQLATTVLGVCLAGLYVISKRSLLPVITAHAIIDAVLEPGLLLSFIH